LYFSHITREINKGGLTFREFSTNESNSRIEPIKPKNNLTAVVFTKIEPQKCDEDKENRGKRSNRISITKNEIKPFNLSRSNSKKYFYDLCLFLLK